MGDTPKLPGYWSEASRASWKRAGAVDALIVIAASMTTIYLALHWAYAKFEDKPGMIFFVLVGGAIGVLFQFLWRIFITVPREIYLKNQEEIAELRKKIAHETEIEAQKRVEALTKKMNDGALGVCYLKLQNHIKKLREISPYAYVHQLDDAGNHKSSDDIISEAHDLIRSQFGISESASFKNAVDFTPTEQLGVNQLSTETKALNWQKDRMVFYAKKLDETIKRRS